LSEQLHLFYARAIEGERVQVITQVAIAMRHEVNNALATLLAEAQILEGSGDLTSDDDRSSLRQIVAMARRVRDAIEKLATLTHSPPTREYILGSTMLDLDSLRAEEPG
jgi:nitrogen-specific signal transduction histidine kinase